MQTYSELEARYSYSLEKQKEQEKYRLYTHQAMESFDNPELEIPYEDSDFDSDTAHAFTSRKDTLHTSMSRAMSKRLSKKMSE